MTIEIKQEVLKKIVNPFEEGFYENFIINEKKITEYVKTVDFIPTDNDSLEEKKLKKIAFLLKNETKEKIIIKNLITANNKVSASFFTGKEKYVAQILKNKEFISLEIVEADKQSMKILNINKNDLTTAYSSYKDSILLTWQINPISIEKTWLNPEFVLAKMKTNKSESIIPMIPEKLWEDHFFQLEAINILKNKMKLLPPSIWNSKKIIEMITEDKDFFKKYWINLIYPLYRFYKTGNINIGYDINNEENIKLIKNNIKNFVLILDKKFKNKKWVMEREEIMDKLYHYLSLDLKLERAIIMKSFELQNNKDSESYSIFNNQIEPILTSIPLEYFDNKENLIEIWNYVQESKRAFWPRYHFNSIVEKLNDKKLLKEILPHLKKGSLIEDLWSSDYFKFKADKELIKKFLELKPSLYNLLPKKLKEENDFKIISLLNNMNKDIKYDFIFELSDEKIIKKLMTLYPTQILNNKKCPPSWRTDKENIQLIGSQIAEIKLSLKELEIITDGKEEEYFKLLELNFELYKSLPIEIKTIEYFAEYFVKKSIQNGHCSYEEIATSVWGNRDFCINTLRENYDVEVLYNIPKIFWKEKEFILAYCKILDEKEVKSNGQLRKQMPEEINKLLEAFDIEENYSQFILNYILEVELINNKINIKKNKL